MCWTSVQGSKGNQIRKAVDMRLRFGCDANGALLGKELRAASYWQVVGVLYGRGLTKGKLPYPSVILAPRPQGIRSSDSRNLVRYVIWLFVLQSEIQGSRAEYVHLWII